MFDSKKKQLHEVEKKPSKSGAFVSAGLKTSAETLSGNYAKKYSTTGNAFVDQFGKLGSYLKPRSFEEIARDCELLWAEDPELCVKFIIYIRMITRKTDILFTDITTQEPQKGGELKHEGIMRMIWLHQKDEDLFFDNLNLFVSAGSWKDVIKMLSYDLQYHGWENRQLNWLNFRDFILSGLKSDSSELLKKYLPQIKSKNKCTTISAQANNMVAKWICSNLYGTKMDDRHSYKLYRKLKSSGTAHEWQQLISKQKFNEIEFDSIHGRALSKLVNSKFLENHGLKEKYEAWISSDDTKAKYTGFVHELFKPLDNGFYNRHGASSYDKSTLETINKQFRTLVEKAGEAEQTPLIVVRDTSGSMGNEAPGSGMSCNAVAKALALYFSEFLEGEFADSWIEFNSTATMHEWKGLTPTDKWFNDRANYIGSTNFQSVIDLFIRIKRSGVPESEFPKGILCISDGEFDPSSLSETNVETSRRRLRQAGFSDEYVRNFIIVLWNMRNNYYGSRSGEKFETYGNVPNVFYFSGYSASTISFLKGKIKNAEQLFLEAMNQELLEYVQMRTI